MAEVATLGLKVEGTEGIDRAKESLDGLGAAAEGAEKKVGRARDQYGRYIKTTDGVTQSTEGVTQSTTQMGKTIGAAGDKASTTTSKLSGLAKVGGLLAAAFSVNQIRQYADTWSDLQSKVGSSLGDMNLAAASMGKIVDIANASYAPLAQSADIFSRNVRTFRDLGKSADDAAKFTEAVNHALVTTATKGQDADVVIGSLSRALSIGKLDADAFDTIVSRSPRVLQAMADEMKTTVSGLRALAMQGKVTSDVISGSFVKSLDQLRLEASEMPATIGDAFVRVNNNLTEFVGRIDKATGASSAIADVIMGFADGIRTAGDYLIHFGAMAAPVFSMISEYAGIALAAIGGFFAPTVIAGIVSTSGALGVGLVGAIKAVTLAMMANPIGLIVGLLAAAAVAAYQFSDDFRTFVGEDVPAFAISAGNKIIGTFVGAFELIKGYWTNFPTFFGAAAIGAVNLYIGALNTIVSGTVSGLNKVIELANSIPGVSIGGIDAGAGQLGLVDNPYAAAAMQAASDAVAAAKAAFDKDWLAGAFEGFALPIFGGAPITGTGGGKPARIVGGAGKENANKKVIDDLAQSLYLAGLEGDALALAQARLKLDQYATPEQIAQVEALTLAIQRANEAAANRGKFGENAKSAESYILGDVSPLSGGAFDDQFARYAAEAVAEEERYASQLERLAMARELQIETNRSYDALEEEAARTHADRMAQIDQAKAQTMLGTAGSAFAGVAEIMKTAAGEQSGIYRAMFAVSKAFSIGEATLNAYNAISKAWASAPFPANLAAVAATTPQVLAVVSAISGTGLSGMAHDGIDSVPKEGTWLLDKGERVMTQNTSARLDSVLDRIDTRTRGGGSATSAAPIVNVIEDASRAGRTEVTQDASGAYTTSVFVANIWGGGAEAEALESAYGLQRVGR